MSISHQHIWSARMENRSRYFMTFETRASFLFEKCCVMDLFFCVRWKKFNMQEESLNRRIYNLSTVEAEVLNGTLKTATSRRLTGGRRNTSNFWTVFKDIQTANGVLLDFVWCPRCEKPMVYDAKVGTNSLRNHLKRCPDPANNSARTGGKLCKYNFFENICSDGC